MFSRVVWPTIVVCIVAYIVINAAMTVVAEELQGLLL